MNKQQKTGKSKASIKLLMGAVLLVGCSSLQANNGNVGSSNTQENIKMTHKAYVYTELQISLPFENVPWASVNENIKKQPGFINKTWLSGSGNNSAGGIYAFDTIENAQKFVTDYFPSEAKGFGVAQTTRIFDAEATEEASRGMNSMHYDGKIDGEPAAFVYTEIQISALPFSQKVAWRNRNDVLKNQQGLMAKTWLSGLHTGTPGGLYAFDTLENAREFAFVAIPEVAQSLNTAFYTRVFDARVTKDASKAMNSPFYR